MSKTSAQSGEKIKKGEADRTEVVLYIVPKNPQIEHISQEMKQTTMEEHGRN